MRHERDMEPGVLPPASAEFQGANRRDCHGCNRIVAMSALSWKLGRRTLLSQDSPWVQLPSTLVVSDSR
jgi:hypothetical protein